jgi:hypothetical protein
MTEPFPVLVGRVDRIERRQDVTDSTVAAHSTTLAVHTEQIAGTREDLVSVAETFKEATAATNARIDRGVRAVWAVVGLLIPTAISLVALVIQNS